MRRAWVWVEFGLSLLAEVIAEAAGAGAPEQGLAGMWAAVEEDL